MTLEVARAIRQVREQEDIERTVDCAIRYLEEAINKSAFKEVRAAIQHLTDYMAERIEHLEELDAAKRLRSVHRQSA